MAIIKNIRKDKFLKNPLFLIIILLLIITIILMITNYFINFNRRNIMEKFEDKIHKSKLNCPKTTEDINNAISKLKIIPKYAFYKCKNLTSITIPESVHEIGYSAFEKCINLTSIILPKSLKNISSGAFIDCPKLTTITIPSSVNKIGSYAFQGCYKNDKKIKNNFACNPPTGLSSIIFTSPSSLKTISEGMFAFSALTKITIPPSVHSIESTAFGECHKLSIVILNPSLISIGYGAFSRCTSLLSIKIPSSVKTIGEKAFMECTKLSTITFEKNSSLKTIGPGAFAITNIKSIIIPSFVTSIGNQAFQECSNLSSVTLPLSLKNIDNSAFSNCPKLTFIKIPSSVESIGNQAFLGCSTYDKKIKGYIACKPPTGLSSVIFISPSSLKTIGESAFSFSALTKIIIPSSVNSIGSYAFAECHKLSTFIFGSGTKSSLITIGDNAFNCCTSLTSIEIPASVKTIEKDTIWGCTKLSSITFEKGSKLSKISSDAFTKCPIKNVTNLPSKIDKSVFKSSTNYKNIQYK